ncbi:uncharacterized protein LOC102805559 [Saccoglossus kowalevskii]|uniref:Uncharacterized protein LOC102805559 n=1 Tax=Saccoglossus kowalevskii TaxID=10224 RepID=A0ABM0MTH3_SACKO|nr:PREDICTED: uncharacterized protein LOC102805559 [Saccoglossus kowalevskii]
MYALYVDLAISLKSAQASLNSLMFTSIWNHFIARCLSPSSNLNAYHDTRPGDVIRDIVCIDALRFTLFLGSYPALYKLALYLVQIYRKQKDGISYIIAAVIASLSAIIDKADRRKRLAMFLFTRALGAAYNALACRGKMPSVPQGTSLVFSASIGVIIVAFVREPQLLSKEYYEGVKTWTRDYTEDILVNYYRKPYGRFVSCDEFLHPGKSCLGHAFHELFASWFTFSKIYLPIHLIPLLLSRQKVIISSPVPSLLSLFMKYVKSATFLTVMCTTIKVVVCLLRQNVHHSPAPVPRYLMFIAGFIGALIGVQFESRSRRGELAMYVASTALDAVFIWGRDAGLFKSLPCGSLLIFIISMAAITHAYERDRDSLSPMVKGGMTFLCGKPENQKVINGDEIPAGKSTQHIDAGNVS